jgi:hypothetical protein
MARRDTQSAKRKASTTHGRPASLPPSKCCYHRWRLRPPLTTTPRREFTTLVNHPRNTLRNDGLPAVEEGSSLVIMNTQFVYNDFMNILYCSMHNKEWSDACQEIAMPFQVPNLTTFHCRNYAGCSSVHSWCYGVTDLEY